MRREGALPHPLVRLVTIKGGKGDERDGNKEKERITKWITSFRISLFNEQCLNFTIDTLVMTTKLKKQFKRTHLPL